MKRVAGILLLMPCAQFLMAQSMLIYTNGSPTPVKIELSQIDSVAFENVKGPGEPISGDLYPLLVGHRLIYGGYLRDVHADTNITATGSVYQTSWTVSSNSYPSPVGGGTAHLVIDSTTIPTGTPTPPIVTVVSPFLLKRPTGTGVENIYWLENFATFLDQVGIVRKPATDGVDTVYYLLLVNMSANVGGSWAAFDSTWLASSGARIRLLITAKWEAKENVTARDNVTYSSYKLSTIRSVQVDNIVLATGPTSTFWFAPYIGPVKMIINSDGVSRSGHFRELKSRNF